jgi:hypothetical protein
VDYVAGPRREDVDYVERLAEREEGGTPAILGDIRAGLAFLVKAMVDPRLVLEHETAMAAEAAGRLSRHPRIRVLGPSRVRRLAILPIEIEGMHHDFASTLLDHLFGIQNRAGCSCAGPYGHRLLGIEPGRSARFRDLVRRGILGIKPGWVRISLPWYASGRDLEFVLSAVEFVATHGMDFAPAYHLDWRSGVWRYREGQGGGGAPLELSVEALRSAGAGSDLPESTIGEEDLEGERARYFEEARRAAGRLREAWTSSPSAWNPPTGDPEVDELAWFRYVDAGGLGPEG